MGAEMLVTNCIVLLVWVLAAVVPLSVHLKAPAADTTKQGD